jgi:hypothetical protein
MFKPPTGATSFHIPAAATRDDLLWMEALGELDFAGDRQPLIDMISKSNLSPIVRELLIDLIKRGIDKPSRRPTTPIYTLSEIDRVNFLAHRDVKALVQGKPHQTGKAGLPALVHKGKMPLAEALKKVADKYGINPRTLASSYKRGNRR